MSSSPPETRSPALTQAQIDRIIAALEQRGANVNVTDPRVSAVQNWILGLIGTGMVTAGLWGANTLSELKVIVSNAIARQAQQDKILDDHEERLRQQERRP